MPIETDLNKLSANSQRIAAINAASQGMTAQQYVTSRGGINTVTGKYGDSTKATDLTDAQYQAAIAGKTGTDRGLAIGAATGENIYNAAIAAIPPKSNTETQSSYDARVKQATDKAKSEQSGSVSNQTNAINAMLSGTSYTPPGGTGSDDSASAKLLAQQEKDKVAEEKRVRGKSAYDILLSEFTKYGLQTLVEPLKDLITSGASSAEFSLELQNTKAYQTRFAANKKRIDAGLGALSPAEYIGLEDQYQNVMRQYGLPASYYTKDPMGTQQGFEKFLAADVSATELEDRIMTAQNRVINSNPEIAFALKKFYPDITNGDILAYALNPQQGLSDIKRKVTAAEIGGAALSQDLTTSLAGAESLAGYGVTKDEAQQGYKAIAGFQPRAGDLASFYNQQEYTQATAEAEVFGTLGAAEAKKRREKLVSLEKASFEGKSGLSQGALGSNRSSNRIQYTAPGAGAY